MSNTHELGPLPEPALTHDRHGHMLLIGPCYTADQMRAYADAAGAAERERCAKLCDANARVKRDWYAKTESDDDRGAAEMAEWLASNIRG